MRFIVKKKTLLQIYHEAVSEDYSFLYVNLMSKDKRKMFMERFERYLIPSWNILIYIMTTFTKSEGLGITYTNYVLESSLLQLHSSNSYYTSGEHDISFYRNRF